MIGKKCMVKAIGTRLIILACVGIVSLGVSFAQQGKGTYGVNFALDRPTIYIDKMPVTDPPQKTPTLQVTGSMFNFTNDPAVFEFMNGCFYRLQIMDIRRAIVWDSLDGKVCTQVITRRILDRDSIDFVETIRLEDRKGNRLPAGSYNLLFTSLSTPAMVSEIPFEIMEVY